jgi:DNA polymerase-3 subunit alpha
MGVKYIHGVECYLTQDKRDNNGSKIRDNFHTILLAKNYEGVKEINLAMSKASDSEHFYYNSRITFDEFFALSNNVIKISACLASPLNRVRKTAFEEIPCETFEKLCYAYDYYEVQPHVYSQEQKEYNRWLADLAKKYNKPLIAGTDTHNLNEYKSACRKILMKYKGQSYGDEDTFDLNYKSYEELVECFKNQKALTEEEYLEAIENTNVMADSVEEFTLDTSFKYPHISDHIEEDFLGKLFSMFNEKLKLGYISQDKKQEYLSRIKEEYEVFKKLDMLSFMLFMSNLIGWCKSNNIPVGLGRGSVSGSLIAYILGITDVDSIEWHTIFSRFANENRKVLADIDVDVYTPDRQQIYDHIIETFTPKYTSYILTIGTIVERGVIDIVGKVLGYSLDELKFVKDMYDNDISDNHQKTRDKYSDIFYYFDGLLNTAISQSMHPAGIVISPIPIDETYGVFHSDGKNICYLNMEELHDCGSLKYDILG